eukprot:s1925_g15.t1
MATFGERNTLGGSARLPLPEKFSGKVEDWEDWSYSVKNYAALLKTDILEVEDCNQIRNVNAVEDMTEEDYEWNEEECDVDWTGALWDDWSDDWSWSDWDWTGHWDEWCDQSCDWSYSESSARHLASPPTQTAQTVQAPATASGTVSTVTGFPNTATTVSSSTIGILQTVSAVSTPLKPRTGPRTGSFGGAFVSTSAALSVLGTTEGTSVHSLPVHFALDDVTVQNGPCDKLAWMHDYCVASVPTERDWVLFDSGAAAHCCPFDYASDYPLLRLGSNPPNLRSATGKPLKMYGRRLVQYDCNGVKLWVSYYVCDVSFCLVSVARMLLQNYWSVLGKDCLLVLTPDHETVPVLRYGTLLYLSPRLVPYCQEWKDTVYHEFDDYMNNMSVDLNNVYVTADEETDPLKKLETLVSTLKPHYYHTDQSTLDEANLTLTRTHKRTRRFPGKLKEKGDTAWHCGIWLGTRNANKKLKNELSVKATHLDEGKGGAQEFSNQEAYFSHENTCYEGNEGPQGYEGHEGKVQQRLAAG